MKTWVITLYILAFLCYIANIVIVCCTGASLINNIFGWVCSIIWAISAFCNMLWR